MSSAVSMSSCYPFMQFGECCEKLSHHIKYISRNLFRLRHFLQREKICTQKLIQNPINKSFVAAAEEKKCRWGIDGNFSATGCEQQQLWKKKLAKVKKSIAIVVVIQRQQQRDRDMETRKTKLWLLSSLACISIRWIRGWVLKLSERDRKRKWE